MTTIRVGQLGKRWASVLATSCLLAGPLVAVSAGTAAAAGSANLTVLQLVDGSSSVTANDGQVLTYTTTVDTTGPSEGEDVYVSELFSTGLTVGAVSAPPGTSYSTASGEWDIGPIAPGESLTLTVVAEVATTASSISTTATVTASNALSTGSAASVSVNAALSVNITASPGDTVASSPATVSVDAGQDVTYQVTASNAGGTTATNVVMTDDLPANFVLLAPSIIPSAATVTVVGDVLTWEISSLPAGSSATLSYTETTNAPSSPQSDPTTVSVTSDQTNDYGTSIPQSTSDVVSVEVIPQAGLEITLTDGKTTVVPGTSDTYALTVTNNGPSAATNATVADVLPSGFTVTGQTASGGTFTNLGNGQVEWTGIDLAYGQVATFTLTGPVDPDLGAGSSFVDVASVWLPAGQVDSDANYTVTDSDTVAPTATLSVEVTDTTDSTAGVSGTFNAATNDTAGGTDAAGASNPLVYTVVVSNASGPSNVDDLFFSDPLPAQISSDTWSVTTTPGSAATVTSGTGNISDTLSLAAGSSITFTVDADIPSSATGVLVDTASLALPQQFTDTNAFTSSTDVVNIESASSLTSQVSSSYLTPGGTVTDTATVQGNSTIGAPTGTVTFYLCQTSTGSSFSPAPCPTTGTLEDSDVSLTGNTASASATSTASPGLTAGTWCFSEVYGVDINYPGSSDNTSASNADTNECVFVAAAGTANLIVSQLVDGSSSVTANDGQVLTYTTMVDNTGPSVGEDVNVSDLFPAGLTVGAVSAPPGTSYSTASGEWDIGAIAPGESLTLTVVAEVATTASSISTTATVTASNGSGAPSSTASVSVNAALSVNITASPGDTVASSPAAVSVDAGQNVTYEVTASNAGGTTATNVVVTDDLPANFVLLAPSIIPSTATVTVVGGVLTWEISSLPAGSSATLDYTETTNAPSSPQSNATTVSVTSDQTDEYGSSIPQSAIDVVSVEVLPQSGLAMTLTDGTTTVVPGTSDTYALTVTNNGPSAATNATVADVLPSGFTVTGQTASGGTFTNLGNGQVEWTGIDLAYGQVATFTLTGPVDPDLGAGSSFVDVASIGLPAGQVDPDANYTVTDSDTVAPTATLSVEVTDTTDSTAGVSGTFNAATNDTAGGTDAAGASNPLVYTVVVSNASGPSTAENLSFSDLLPAQISSDTWSVTSTPGSAATVTSGTGNISDTLSLAAGSYLTFTIDAYTLASATGVLVDTASLTLPQQFTDTNAFTSSTDVVSLESASSLTSQVSSSYLTPGGTVTDTATVQGNATIGAPTGTVTFYLCQTSTGSTFSPASCPASGTAEDSAVSLTGTATSANATSTASAALSAGTWCFSVVYGGDNNYPGSSDNTSASNADTNECVFVAASEQTSTALGLSRSSLTYGSEIPENFTMTVTGQSGDGYPVGTVAVYSSSALLCHSSLGTGSGDVATGSCSLSATALPAGSYTDVFASYTPAALSSSNSSYAYTGSNSPPAKKLLVAPASTAVALSLTSPITYGAEGSAPVKVTVSAIGTTPAGSVTVEANGTTMCTVALSANGSGTCAPSASKLAPGTYFVIAVYAPANSDFVGSLSSPLILTVKRAGTSIAPSLVASAKGKSENLQFSGTLTSSATGLPVAGRALVFMLNSHGASSCSAITNASGLAACSLTVTSNVFKTAATYSASFGGDADYLASTISAKIP